MQLKIFICFHIFSNNIEEDPPPPLHKLATPSWPGSVNDPVARWLVIRAPDIPNGCPIAIAPP